MICSRFGSSNLLVYGHGAPCSWLSCARNVHLILAPGACPSFHSGQKAPSPARSLWLGGFSLRLLLSQMIAIRLHYLWLGDQRSTLSFRLYRPMLLRSLVNKGYGRLPPRSGVFAPYKMKYLLRSHSGDYQRISGAKRILRHDRHKTFWVVDRRLVRKTGSGRLWVDAQPA